MSIASDLAMLETYDETIQELELFLRPGGVSNTTGSSYQLLRTVAGHRQDSGSDDRLRDPRHGTASLRSATFSPTADWSRGDRESAGKKGKPGGAKMGNVHLKWAFSEAAALFSGGKLKGQKLVARLERKHGRGKAMGVLAARLGRAVYYMIKRNEPFDLKRFVTA